MIDNSWAFDLDSIIYTLIKNKIEKSTKTKYPNMRITNSDRAVGEPVYPTVFLKKLPFQEDLETLDGKTINALNVAYQVEVITDKTQNEANKIMAIVLGAYKDLGFNIKSFGEFENSQTYYRLLARVNRNIGANDKFS